jgi:predicted RNA-binding protein with TRAM domain
MLHMFRDQGFRKSSPLEEGQEIDVTIEAVGEKGDGIAKSKGFVIFVPGVKQGDHVRVRITKVLRNFSFGEVVGQATGSPKEGEEQAEEGGEAEGSSEAGSSEDSENFSEDEQKDEQKEDTEEENE